MGTGGAPPLSPLDDSLARVEEAVPHVAVRVPNSFDSDRPSQSPFSMPSSQAVTDIIGGMGLGNAQPEDSDDEFVMSLGEGDQGAFLDGSELSSPAPPLSHGGPSTDDTAKRASCSQTTEDGRAQEGSSAEAVARRRKCSRLTAVDTALSTELEARLLSAEEERNQRRIEHERRLQMIKDEHAFKTKHYAVERRKRSALHKMKVRVLKAKEQVQKLKREIPLKKLQLLAPGGNAEPE
ncbi:uncharacterized protein LOC144129074 [Amblyomma americanum]